MSLTKVKINLGTEGNLSGSRSIVQSTKTLVSGSAQIHSDISGSFNAASSSFSTRVATIEGSGTAQGVGTSNSPTFNNITATGTLTAQEIHTEFTSASILFTSGSTKTGNSMDDVHNMTGSLNISGSLDVNDGNLSITDKMIAGSGSGFGFSDTNHSFTVKSSGNNSGFSVLSSAGSELLRFIQESNDSGKLDMYDGGSLKLRLSAHASENSYINNGGKLGIGTNNPVEMLEIYNTTSPAIQLNDGGEYKGIFRLAGNDLEIRGSSGKLELYNGSADGDSESTPRMVINNSGNVGIGTDSPTFHSGGGLHISNATAARLHLTDSDAGEGTGDGMYVAAIGTEAYVYNFENDALIFGTNTSERMRIVAGGNVGIGKSSIDMARVGRTALEIGAEGTLYSGTSSAQGGVTGLGHNYYYDASNQAKFMRANEEAATMEIYNGGFYFYSDERTDQSADANVTVSQKMLISNDGYIIHNNPSGGKASIWRYDNDGNYQLSLTQDVSSGLVKHTFDLTNAGSSYNDNLVLDRGLVGIGTISPSGSLHIYSNEPTIRLVDANHASNTYIALNANSSAGSLEIGADVSNAKDGSGVSIQVDGAEKLQVSGSGEVVGRIGAPARFSGNWEVLDVVSLNSAAGHMQSENCFNDNFYSHFKIVIPYINVASDGAEVYFTFLYNSGGGLTSDGSQYYGHKQTMAHGSSGYAGGAYSNTNMMTIFDNCWADDSGGIYGQIDVYNVTTGDTRNFPSKFTNHNYTGDGDRGSNFRPFAKFELMGYETGLGYCLQHGAFRNNNDRHASYWKGFKIEASTGNLVASSKMIISGMVL